MNAPESSALPAVEPTLRFFTECFERLGVEWCIGGAVAANAYRDPRATTDLDLVVQIGAEQYLAVSAALREAGWQIVRRSPESDYPDIVRLRHPTFFATDLLLVKTAYQAEALRRARSASVGGGFKLLSPEDVLVHKLIAYRHRDRADVHEILRSQPALDHAYIEQWCDFWGIADRWRESLDEVR